MFKFKILKQSKKLNLRSGQISTNHGNFKTPVFMPCATKATVKAISPQKLIELGYKIILSNTYHLYLRPGLKIIKKAQGLHKFMKWPNPILTDSGGFQVFSLKRASQNSIKNKTTPDVKITDDGVEFKDHLTGDKHFFTPEKVISIQLELGSDILMPLDVCLSHTATKKQHKKAIDLTIKWAKRSKIALEKLTKRNSKKPALFGIVQGGTDPDLRKYCAQKLIEIGFSGYAIGGLAVGEKTKDMLKIIKILTKILPPDKPRYLMGVGEPEDIVNTTKLGIDMFDCVLPTRLARHGTIWTTKNWQKFKKIDLSKAKSKLDLGPIMSDCKCYTCSQKFSKSYLSHLVKEKEILAINLLSQHNLCLLNELINKIRKSI